MNAEKVRQPSGSPYQEFMKKSMIVLNVNEKKGITGSPYPVHLWKPRRSCRLPN